MANTLHEEQPLDNRRFDFHLFTWILSYARDGKRGIVFSVTLVLLGALLALAMPYLTKMAVDSYVLPKNYGGLLFMAGVLLAFRLAEFVVKWLQIYLMASLGQRIMYRLRVDVFHRILHLPKRFFDRNATGRIMTRATSDIEALNELLTSGFMMFLGNFVVLIGVVFFLLFLNWRLGLLVLTVVPMLVVAFHWYRKRIAIIYRQERTLLGNLNSALQETLAGMSVIQAFHRQVASARSFVDINGDYFAVSRSAVFVFVRFFPFVSFLSVFAKAMIVWFGGTLVVHHKMSVGEIVAFIGYVEMFFYPLHDLFEKYDIFQSAMAASEKIKSVFTEVQAPEYASLGKHKAPIRGDIEFQDVWFAYDGETFVLKGVSFCIRAGEMVAVVGQTGSGKTTLINLLGRFYEIQKGRILLDGVDLRDWDIGWVREHIGVVLQDVVLFSGTVRENIALHEQADNARLEEIIRFMQADALVARLPQGLDTSIIERGRSLSVGQRQLISFARTLFRNPSILVLDEATANIDSETEHFLQDATQKLTQGRSSIVIAHRLSTIQHAHRILVLHKGELRESGSHAELLEKRGIYFDLYQLQFAGR